MNINEMTIGEAKELAAMFHSKGGAEDISGAYRVGDKVFIRTVTMNLTGRIVEVYRHEIVLEDAAWIADSGRFNEALKNGTLKEVEPADGRVLVGRGAVVDCWEWKHDLPRGVK